MANPVASVVASGRSETAAKKLSYKEKQELDGLPDKIEQLESEQATMHEKMGEPDYFKQAAPILAKDQARLTEIERLLEEALRRWDELGVRDV